MPRLHVTADNPIKGCAARFHVASGRAPHYEFGAAICWPGHGRMRQRRCLESDRKESTNRDPGPDNTNTDVDKLKYSMRTTHSSPSHPRFRVISPREAHAQN